MDELKPILNIINQRTTIINAIHNYQQQSKTMEGCANWTKTLGITSKIGQSAVEKLNASLNPISKIATNQNIDKNIQEAAKCLMSHLPNLKRTYEAISLTNASKISKATEGTMTIPTRSLTAMIDTLPPFSGQDDPDTVTWLEFQIAMEQYGTVKRTA